MVQLFKIFHSQRKNYLINALKYFKIMNGSYQLQLYCNYIVLNVCPVRIYILTTPLLYAHRSCNGHLPDRQLLLIIEIIIYEGVLFQTTCCLFTHAY